MMLNKKQITTNHYIVCHVHSSCYFYCSRTCKLSDNSLQYVLFILRQTVLELIELSVHHTKIKSINFNCLSLLYKPRHAKRVILIKAFVFLFAECILFQDLLCEILSSITVKMSFLWGRKHCVYAAASFAASVTS